MILTVTLNTGVDRVLLIDELLPGFPVNARKEVVCVGGKGLDASVALSGLGVPSTGLSFMAGQNGKLLEQIVNSYGIPMENVWVDGDTRICYVIAEAKHRRVSHIKLGELLVSERHIQELIERFRGCLKEAQWVIFAGSVPAYVRPGLFGELIGIANQAGVPTLIDSSTQAVLEAIPHHPSILKMNRDEFNHTFGVSTQSYEEIQAAAAKILLANQLESLVLTCGAEGMAAVTRQAAYQVRVPSQEVVNAAGAGDAASAALAWRLSQGDDWAQALQWAGAVSAASVLTEATGEVVMRDAEAIYPLVEVKVQPLPC